MKKSRKKYKLLKSIFFTKKQIIFSFLTFLLLFIPTLNITTKEKSSKIIKFTINGDITILDSINNNIIQNTLNSPLIFTKINETNMNWNDNNILPTKNGEINYIDSYQHITLLDISLEEFYINSPLIIKKYPNFLFISNRTISLFALNMNNGSIYNIEYTKNDITNNIDICPQNENDVLFLRINYYLQMEYTYINNMNNKNKFNDLIWYSHYVKIIPIYPYINIHSNSNCDDCYLKENNINIENDDYYIFEVIENKNINLIYSQDKDIYMQIKDIENKYNFNYNYYYFKNNKRKHLFKYNIIKKDEKNNLSFKFKKLFFLLIIIFVLSAFSFQIYKSQIKINSYNSFKKNKKNENIIELKNDLINKESIDENNNKNILVKKQENLNEKPKSPKSKSISNLSTNCSIENETKIKSKIGPIQSFSLSNIKFNFKKNLFSNKKRDMVKHSSSKTSIHQKRRMSHKKAQNIKYMFKKIKKSTDIEKKELNDLFATYINDITKNTNESTINLNFNLSDDIEKYKKIFSLIKSDDSSSSEEINLDEENQGLLDGEFENNFLFYFDNGRLLKTYKDFEFIGKGGFGVVFKATNKIDESQCAIKVMKINLDLKEENEDLKVTQEIKTMLKFKKKNIVRYKTCWFEFNKKTVKKKRKRAMSLEQRNPPSNDFKEDFLEKGEKKIKKRLSKHLKTPLERISSISKELKLAEANQNDNIQKNNKKRKLSMIWDSDEEESDADSLGANKNYAIKEEGDDKYINLDDEENEAENDDQKSNEINDIEEKEENSNESDNNNDSDNDNENDNDDEEKNDIDDSNNNENEDNIINNKRKRNIDMSSNSNSNLNVKNNKDDNNEKGYEDDNLENKNCYNESSSKNVDNTNSENYINIDKDSENNSIFEEEKKKEKEELNIKNKNLNEDSFIDEDDEDDLKNNSIDGLGVSKQKKNKKKKKYPIYFFIQMEYCSGCPMNYYLSHRAAVPSKKLTTYMLYQMCKAVKHIHDGNIIHRDLKPGNIFIIDDYLIKIGDFGLALNSEKIQEKQGGTYLYQSPEQINNKPYDEKIDIFALGVILVELVSKFNTEFERREILQGLKKSCYPEYLKKDHLKEYNLVVKMTRLNPKERPNIKEILKDNDFIELINESLNSD